MTVLMAARLRLADGLFVLIKAVSQFGLIGFSTEHVAQDIASPQGVIRGRTIPTGRWQWKPVCTAQSLKRGELSARLHHASHSEDSLGDLEASSGRVDSKDAGTVVDQEEPRVYESSAVHPIKPSERQLNPALQRSHALLVANGRLRKATRLLVWQCWLLLYDRLGWKTPGGRTNGGYG